MPGKTDARLMGKSQPTIFGRIAAKNVTFLIDISGSMYHILDDVKKQLIEAISEKSINDYDAMFNVIAFSDDIYPWASSLMPCTPRTVSIVSQWITNLESKASTNTQDALLAALEDEKTDAIYLITDGLPNDRPSVILRNVEEGLKGRKIHCFYISGSKDDSPAVEFLEMLAEMTGGSLHLLYDENGRIVDVEKVSVIGSEISSVSSLEPRKEKFNGNYYEQYDQYEDHRVKPRYAGSNMTSEDSNLAASVMKGKRVLARRDIDGYYYLGVVLDVMPRNTFMVKFDDCPALLSRHEVQNTSLKNMISYEDALRNDIHVGEKVLAPVCSDGKYEPGTVVEGYDIRKARNSDDDCQDISVSIFDGRTVDVPCGLSVKISESMNKRVRDELHLPESLRRSGVANDSTMPHQKISDISPSQPSNIRAREHHSRGVSKRVELNGYCDHDRTDLLQSKIERQIKEGEMLLQKLHLEDEEYARELGYAPSLDSQTTYDSYAESRYKVRPKIDHESFRNWKEKVLTDTFRSTPKPTKNAWFAAEEPEKKALVETDIAHSTLESHNRDEKYHKHRLELLNHWEKNRHTAKYSPYIVYGTQSSPKQEEKATQVAANYEKPGRKKKITFRTTTLKSQNQPKIRHRHLTEPRPTSNEYHAFNGTPFPPSTDRKFKSDAQTDSWTVEKSSIVPAQRMNIITHQPEYYASMHNTTNRRREVNLNETHNAAWEKRQQDLANERAKKEKIFKERQEYHRANIEQREKERQNRIRKYREGEELNKQKSREMRENFVRYQKEKEEKAQRYKQERLDAMRDRRMNRSIQETNREKSVAEAKEKLAEGYSVRENQRRYAFEASLDSEIKMQEKKLERLRKIHASRLNKEDTRTARAFNSRDLSNYVQDQSKQMFRASVLP